MFSFMPWGLKRFQQARCLHFVTFSCYHRAPLLAIPEVRCIFEQTLERVRKWYGLYVTGYVVMPEHVHLLISEPERASLAVAIQMLKQIVSYQLHKLAAGGPFWQARYYDFKGYIHRNPVKRGLVESPEQWAWSSQLSSLHFRRRGYGGNRVPMDSSKKGTAWLGPADNPLG